MEKFGLINDGNQVSCLPCISDTHCIGDKASGGKQNWLKDVILQEFCTIQNKYDRNNHAPVLLENKFLQNVTKQSSPITQCNVSILFSLLLYELVEVEN